MSHAPAHPPRVLVTKLGLDGHDRGSRVVAAALRDAGHEVVYTGPWQQIAVVVKLALEEDVDVIGVSSLANDHLLVPKLMAALAEADLGHVRVVVGGIVPDEDERMLLAAGVSRVFHPGSSREDIVATIGRLAHDARQAQAGLPDHATHPDPEPGAAPEGAHP
jgi:methylmalonyl-CoA mutase, C-terminal domain